MSRTMKCFVLTIVVLLCAAPVLHSQDLSKAEEKEVNDYRLSKAKITQFSQATKNLLAAAQKPSIYGGFVHAPGKSYPRLCFRTLQKWAKLSNGD